MLRCILSCCPFLSGSILCGSFLCGSILWGSLLYGSPAFALSNNAAAAACGTTVVFEDLDRDGVRDPGEPGLAGVGVSDGHALVRTDAAGRFVLPPRAGARTVFVIKPAGFALTRRADGLPDAWRNLQPAADASLRYGGIPAGSACGDFGLLRESPTPQRARGLRMLVFGDPQPKDITEVGYYARDIVDPLVAAPTTRMHGSGLAWAGQVADLGISLGDIVDDDLLLYPAMKRATAKLGVPWLHVAGNHDMDLDAARDEDALLTFRHHFGPDTFAWEEAEANIVVLDDVIHQPRAKPAYIGGLRDAQFAFLRDYLASADRSRLLVLAMHIPLFEQEGRDTFRDADRARLFALLRGFPHVLVLSAHAHTQRHVLHGADSGWHGARPLHEYNVGAACGAYWSGVPDATGIPAATMADGTPNGYARLEVAAGGDYRLSWHAARGQGGDAIGMHAPRVLRRNAYPAFGVYANVFMGRDDTRVEYRVDGGEWRPMRKVLAPDPALLAENARDDAAHALRGYDRSPEATPSPHLWRGTLPTDLATGEHSVEVRAFDTWQGEQRAATRYRLDDAAR
jgi:hypothetical protein